MLVVCSSIQVTYSKLQYPCGYSECKQYFKSLRGYTKHHWTVHPVLSLASVYQSPTNNHITEAISSSDINEEPSANSQHYGNEDFPRNKWDEEHFNDLDVELAPGTKNELHHPPEPDPVIYTEFCGPGNRLYCSYHQKLNGTS